MRRSHHGSPRFGPGHLHFQGLSSRPSKGGSPGPCWSRTSRTATDPVGWRCPRNDHRHHPRSSCLRANKTHKHLTRLQFLAVKEFVHTSSCLDLNENLIADTLMGLGWVECWSKSWVANSLPSCWSVCFCGSRHHADESQQIPDQPTPKPQTLNLA